MDKSFTVTLTSDLILAKHNESREHNPLTRPELSQGWPFR